MRLIGLPELLVVVGALFGLVCIMFFVLWKFYQVFKKINDNIAGIRQALQKSILLR